MATRKFSITGQAMWAKVFDSNKELKDWQGVPHPFGALFKIDLILDKENKAIYKSSGTAGKGKFDDDGNFIATLKRKEKEKFEWAGGAPEVINADGTPFEGSLIPNGSTVEAEFSVYTTAMSPGTRLEKIIVHSLAEMPERREDTTKVEEPKVQPSKISTEIPF